MLTAYLVHKGLYDAYNVQQATVVGLSNFAVTEQTIVEAFFVGIDNNIQCLKSCASSQHTISGQGIAGDFSCALVPAVSVPSPNAAPGGCKVTFVTSVTTTNLPAQFSLQFSLLLTRTRLLYLNITSLLFSFNGVSTYGMTQSIAPPAGSVFWGTTPTQVQLSLQPFNYTGNPSASQLPLQGSGYLTFPSKNAAPGSTVNASDYWTSSASYGTSIQISFSLLQTVQAFSLLATGSWALILSSVSALVLGALASAFGGILSVGESLWYYYYPHRLKRDMEKYDNFKLGDDPDLAGDKWEREREAPTVARLETPEEIARARLRGELQKHADKISAQFTAQMNEWVEQQFDSLATADQKFSTISSTPLCIAGEGKRHSITPADPKRHSILSIGSFASPRASIFSPTDVELTTFTPPSAASPTAASPHANLLAHTAPRASFKSMQITSELPLWKRLASNKPSSTPS